MARRYDDEAPSRARPLPVNLELDAGVTVCRSVAGMDPDGVETAGCPSASVLTGPEPVEVRIATD